MINIQNIREIEEFIDNENTTSYMVQDRLYDEPMIKIEFKKNLADISENLSMMLSKFSINPTIDISYNVSIKNSGTSDRIHREITKTRDKFSIGYDTSRIQAEDCSKNFNELYNLIKCYYLAKFAPEIKDTFNFYSHICNDDELIFEISIGKSTSIKVSDEEYCNALNKYINENDNDIHGEFVFDGKFKKDVLRYITVPLSEITHKIIKINKNIVTIKLIVTGFKLFKDFDNFNSIKDKLICYPRFIANDEKVSAEITDMSKLELIAIDLYIKEDKTNG